MTLNAINSNFITLLSSVGNLPTNTPESSSKENFFSSLPERDSLESLLGENGRNLENIESPIEVLLLIASLIFRTDLNKEESKVQDSDIQPTSSSNSELTETLNKFYITTTQGKEDPYSTIATKDSVLSFIGENPELFDENTKTDKYIEAFDALAEKGTVVKNVFHQRNNVGENITLDNRETTIIELDNGLYLQKVDVRYKSGKVVSNRAILANNGSSQDGISYRIQNGSDHSNGLKPLNDVLNKLN